MARSAPDPALTHPPPEGSLPALLEVPVIPSPPDLWAVVAIRQVLANVSEITPAWPRAWPTSCPGMGIAVLDTQIGDLEAFGHAAAGGITAPPGPAPRPAEIERMNSVSSLAPLAT